MEEGSTLLNGSGRQVHLHHHHHHYRHQQQGNSIDLLKLWAMKALLATVVVVGGLGYVLTAMHPPGFHVFHEALRGVVPGQLQPHLDIIDQPIKVLVTHHKTGTELSIRILRAAHEVHRGLHHNRSNGLLMGYFGNKPLTETPDSPPPFHFIDALYSKEMFYDRPDDWHEHFTPKEMDFHHFFDPSTPHPPPSTTGVLAKGLRPASALVSHGGLWVLHLVRDPVDLVVSAFLYHKGGPPPQQEPWLYERHPLVEYAWALQESKSCKPPPHVTNMSWHEVLTCLDDDEGIQAEVVFQTSLGTLPAMIAAVKHLTAKAAQDTHGTVRYAQLSLDDFRADWEGSLTRLFTYFDTPPHELALILEACSVHDLKRKSPSELASSTHVTANRANRKPLLATVERLLPSNPVMVEARQLFGRRGEGAGE